MQKSQNPLRKLSKLQLLELLAQQERELQTLRKELAEKEAALADRRIQVESAGSIAEAALKINEVFEAAQRAAEQYLESVWRQSWILHWELTSSSVDTPTPSWKSRRL